MLYACWDGMKALEGGAYLSWLLCYRYRKLVHFHTRPTQEQGKRKRTTYTFLLVSTILPEIK